jgi:uncharacterized iron-regulated membrane protein
MSRVMRSRRAVVRLHRWISLVLGAWIALMAVTGFILVFRADLQRLTRPELYRHGDGEDIGPAAARQAVARAFPDRVLGRVTLPRHNGGVYTVENESEARDYETFVDPATGAVNGSVDEDGGFLNVTYRLHEDLMQDRILGLDGDALVAWLTVAWGIVMIVGIYIWYWPRIRRRLTDGVRVRRGRGAFTFNLDLHRALGILTVVPLMVVALTGINFAFDDQIEGFWERVTPAGEDHVSPAEDPVSTDAGHPDRGPVADDEAVAIVAAMFPGGTVTSVEQPEADEPEGTVRVNVTSGWDPERGPLGYAGNVRVELDRTSGRVVYVGDPDDFNVATQLYDRWDFPLHTGSFGGTATRYAWLAVAAAPAVLSVTGLRMWMIRRQKRRARSGTRAPGSPRFVDVREPDGDEAVLTSPGSGGLG